MKPWLVRLAWVGALVVAALGSYRLFFPSPEHVMRKELTQLARAASIAPNEGALTKVAKTETLLSFFTPDAQLVLDVPGRSIQTVNGRAEIQQAILAARSMLGSLRVEFVDVMITLAADRQSAVADLTATASLPGEKIPEVQELQFRFKQIERDWLIEHVETVKTLR